MTSKEKAIKALVVIGNVEISDTGWTVSDNYNDECNTISLELRKPTLDDAIKVVEEIKQDMAKTYSIVCETIPQKAIATTVDNILYDILTALKGLKERE